MAINPRLLIGTSDWPTLKCQASNARNLSLDLIHLRSVFASYLYHPPPLSSHSPASSLHLSSARCSPDRVCALAARWQPPAVQLAEQALRYGPITPLPTEKLGGSRISKLTIVNSASHHLLQTLQLPNGVPLPQPLPRQLLPSLAQAGTILPLAATHTP